ncbi:MAG: hypothetical protein LBC43_03805 [Bifidobacteriaceae bacterium]|jgi:hypothetical protein|nr:hypothetical protein [Bifidobacteriaceae bacterium]
MGYLLLLLYHLAGTSALAYFFKRSFQKLLPFTILGTILVIYIFGLFNLLLVGLWVAVLLVVFGVVWLVLQIVKDFRKFRATFFNYILTPGMVVFSIIFSYVCFINQGRTIHDGDDFAHWGPMVKEMLRLNQFYDVPESLSLGHPDYPPAISVYKYFFEFIGGGAYGKNLGYLMHNRYYVMVS